MSPDVLQGLVQSALSDSYMTVLMDAKELLAHRDIDDATRTALSMSLASEIVAPTPELWANSRGIREHETLNDRAVTVLADLHVSPYPDHVIGANTVRLVLGTLETNQRIHKRARLQLDEKHRIYHFAFRRPPMSLGDIDKLVNLLVAELVA